MKRTKIKWTQLARLGRTSQSVFDDLRVDEIEPDEEALEVRGAVEIEAPVGAEFVKRAPN
jgi:hypothetical protein